jgi:hypothetical protein
MTNETKPATANVDESGRRTSASNSTLVFISHDSRDAELAEAFSKLLSSVSAGVLKSFRSSDRKGTQGIEYGVEWYPTLMSKIESASDVVCLLTQRSIDRPWILYEAGVAKGKLDRPVHGVALGVSLSQANSGPFAQFQNSGDEEDSLTKLVMQLLKRIPGSEPDHDAVQMQVRSFKEKVGTVLKALKDPETPQQADPLPDASSIAKLFEEVKVMFQDLPSRLEARLMDDIPQRKRRFRRMHPMMLEKMMHMLSEDPGDPIALLLLAGSLRDDLPWLAEVIAEAYRQVRDGDTKAIQKLRRTLKNIDRGPFLEEMGFESKDMHMILMELPMMLDHYEHRLETRNRKHNPPPKKEGPDNSQA